MDDYRTYYRLIFGWFSPPNSAVDLLISKKRGSIFFGEHGAVMAKNLQLFAFTDFILLVCKLNQLFPYNCASDSIMFFLVF